MYLDNKMANTVAKVCIVKCPKCLELLPEFADVPMYQCGGCGTALRAKNSENYSSFSFNAENYCHENGESSGSIVKRESSDIDARCIEERNSVNANIPACSFKDVDIGSDQTKTEYSFSEDEEEEKSMNLGERGSDTLRSFHKSEASLASLSRSVASEEEILDEDRQSNSLSSPTVASSDNGSPVHVREMYHLMSRRTSRRQWGSSSGRSNIGKEKRVTSLGSESFYSIQNSIESEKDEPYFRRDSSTREFERTNSPKPKNLNQNRSELLKLVEGLKHQLGRSYELKEEKKRISQFSRSNPLQPTFFSHDRRSQQLPQRYQSSQMPLSYQHCHLQPDFCRSYSSCGACSHNLGCHSSKAKGPPQLSYTHKSRPAKRFFRPVLGSAPFVICYKCFEMLHMPAHFLISTNKLNKLKCGACSEILLLPFPARAHPVPQVSAENGNSSEGPVSFSEENGISFAESCSTETGPALNTSRVSSDESRNVNSHGLPLHRVMGYPSARQLL